MSSEDEARNDDGTALQSASKQFSARGRRWATLASLPKPCRKIPAEGGGFRQPSRLRKWSGGARLLWAHFFLFLGALGLDQSTKFHAQSALMTWSHPSQTQGYRADRNRVLTLGESPSSLSEKGRDRKEATAAWVDLNVTYVRNPGAAWGSFLQLPPQQRIAFFYGVTLLATLAVAFILANSSPRQRILRLGLVFLLSGAAGNFVDRLLLGYVIDWIHLHWKIGSWQMSFPVFNVADAAVHVGLVALVIDMLGAPWRKETAV